MSLIGQSIIAAVEKEITDYSASRLANLSVDKENYVIKFVNSRWAAAYEKSAPLYISTTPALTWGTATYVTPLKFPLSSALYGRIGLVSKYDPSAWRIFDATRPAARAAYVSWIQAQPAFRRLVLTVHSTHANHLLRNRFREKFQIDCVLFRPDQKAELHTDLQRHVWMAVTDWTANPDRAKRKITTGESACFSNSRFTVLIDEDFALLEASGLPIQKARRRIEQVTSKIPKAIAVEVGAARSYRLLPTVVKRAYDNDEYLHIYIKP